MNVWAWIAAAAAVVGLVAVIWWRVEAYKFRLRSLRKVGLDARGRPINCNDPAG